jgi:hypothetical protein
MNRYLARTALLVLLALAACSQMAAGTGRGPFAPYSPDDSGSFPAAAKAVG